MPEHEAESPDVRELRSRQRFVAVPPLQGLFGATEIEVQNLGEGGIQVEHAMPLKLGAPSGVTIKLQSGDRITMRGRVVWSRLSKTPNDRGKYLYQSGIRLEGEIDRKAVHELITSYCRPDTGSLVRKQKALLARAAALASKPAVTHTVSHVIDRIPHETVMIVQQVRERLRTQPEEAVKWNNRARFAIAEKTVREAEELHKHNREEILAIWEFLERSVDLKTISEIFDAHRK